MKKMMTFAAVVCMAALTQAAAIDWAVNGYVLGEGDTTLPSGDSSIGISVYLINAAQQEGIEDAIKAGSFEVTTAGVLAMKVSSAPKGAVSRSTAEHDSLVSGTSYNFAILFFDTVEGVQQYNISGSLPQLAYIDGTEESALILFTSDQVAAGTGWVAVPEPTSMALLALGVAALGLRRKFRA